MNYQDCVKTWLERKVLKSLKSEEKVYDKTLEVDFESIFQSFRKSTKLREELLETKPAPSEHAIRVHFGRALRIVAPCVHKIRKRENKKLKYFLRLPPMKELAKILEIKEKNDDA